MMTVDEMNSHVSNLINLVMQGLFPKDRSASGIVPAMRPVVTKAAVEEYLKRFVERVGQLGLAVSRGELPPGTEDLLKKVVPKWPDVSDYKVFYGE